MCCPLRPLQLEHRQAGSPAAEEPFYSGPQRYVIIPRNSQGPLFSRHNHDPAICECPNGDLLAIWYSCIAENGRELNILASRKRARTEDWEPASVFWDAPDRNDHAPALWCDGETIYHFNGLSVAGTWGSLATILRTSSDSGATWSPARFIIPEHGPRHMPIASVFALSDGTIVLPCDAVTGGHGGTALWLSEDRGETWKDPGGTIAGIHGSAVDLADGTLMAFGRGLEIEGKIPMSLSKDRGKTWSIHPGNFPPLLISCQRLVCRRIKGTCREGTDPILFISFSNEPLDSDSAFTFTDESGKPRPLTGMYCAVSFDDGNSWPFIRPVSDDRPDRVIESLDSRPCIMGPGSGENNGYLTACQSKDGTVHLISSTNHYSFNLAWLVSKPPGYGLPSVSDY